MRRKPVHIPGYAALDQKETEILQALLKEQGIESDSAKLREPASATAKANPLGIDWCRVLCAIKAAARIVQCGGDPTCIAKAVAEGLACAQGCK
jgi:hypothetical protein